MENGEFRVLWSCDLQKQQSVLGWEELRMCWTPPRQRQACFSRLFPIDLNLPPGINCLSLESSVGEFDISQCCPLVSPPALGFATLLFPDPLPWVD